MNYEEAKGYIHHLNMFGMKLGLERVERLLSLLGNPETGFRSIIVGGTSGKGSTAVMIASILKEAGFNVGLFVKPHLFDFRERISVRGGMISEKDFVRLAGKLKPYAEKVGREFETPTFFEFVTALALEYFKERRIDIAVLEVGLGGRLDSTNVVDPEVSVITNVSLEHTDILGDTVEKIAKEKAGIIRGDRVLVTGSDDPKVIEVLREACRVKGSRFTEAEKLGNVKSDSRGNSFEFDGSEIHVPLGGRYQLSNISCALSAVKSLGDGIPTNVIKRGLEKVEWPCRFELVNERPTVLLDGAKDPSSMRKVIESLDLLGYEKLYTVLAVSKDKLLPGIIKEAGRKTDKFVLAMHKVNGRSMDTKTLAREAEKQGKDFVIVDDVKAAVRKAMKLSGREDLVLVTGSLFTVAEARELWFRKKTRFGRELNENIEQN